MYILCIYYSCHIITSRHVRYYINVQTWINSVPRARYGSTVYGPPRRGVCAPATLRYCGPAEGVDPVAWVGDRESGVGRGGLTSYYIK